MLALLRPPPTPNASERRFALAFARALRRYGSPAHEVEDGFDAFARRIGETVRVHVLPTSLIATDTAQEPPVAWFYPDSGGPMVLERLEAAHEVAEAFVARTIDAEEALRRLDRVESAPPRWTAVAAIVASAATSAATAAFLGGGVREAGVASAIGGGTAALSAGLSRFPKATPLIAAAAAFTGGFALQAVGVPVAPEIALLAGLVTFLPGFTLTTALSEIATGHRMTGTGGLVTAATTLLHLGFGVALGTRIGALVFGAAPVAAATPFPAWHLPISTIVFAGTLLVALQIRARWLPAVIAGCTAAVVGEQVGGAWLGPDLGGAFGALCVALVAGLFARLSGRHAATVQVPGLLVLVPGTIGFRAVQALVGQDVQGGVESAFAMVLAATGLAGGTLLGAALVGRSTPVARPLPPKGAQG